MRHELIEIQKNFVFHFNACFVSQDSYCLRCEESCGQKPFAKISPPSPWMVPIYCPSTIGQTISAKIRPTVVHPPRPQSLSNSHCHSHDWFSSLPRRYIDSTNAILPPPFNDLLTDPAPPSKPMPLRVLSLPLSSSIIQLSASSIPSSIALLSTSTLRAVVSPVFCCFDTVFSSCHFKNCFSERPLLISPFKFCRKSPILVVQIPV